VKSAALEQNDPNLNYANDSSSHQQDDWVHSWMSNVDEARASQPHFVSPMVTTHVMLVQQYRYDMSWQQDPSGGAVTSSYGASRGLEIIPTTRLEVGIFPPGYLVHQSNTPDGFGDLSWQVKFRPFSATERKGDYFVGFFLGGSFPTGTSPNGLGHTVLSPTFAAAKGIGPWDIQGKLGRIFRPLARTCWAAWSFSTPPSITESREKSGPCSRRILTFWSGGTLDGKEEVFLTPGLVVGSFPLVERLHLMVGAGVQIAVTQFHQYNHRSILSVRFPFWAFAPKENPEDW
jgi:hypothetical protein